MSVFSTADAHDAIVATVVTMWEESEFDDVKLYGNNGPAPNLDDLKKCVNFEIDFSTSEQVTIAKNPIDRTWGSIEFHFGVREGTGIRAARVMQAYVKEYLKAGSFGSVKTLIPSPGPTKVAKGWRFETLYVPFYFDGMPIANTHD